MAGAPSTEKRVYRDITFKGADHPAPWSDIRDPEYGKMPPWAPRKILPIPESDDPSLPGQPRMREFPHGGAGPSMQDSSAAEEKAEGAWWGAKLRR